MNKVLAVLFAIVVVAATVGPATAGERTRTVFITGSSHTGNLGGLTGADKECQAEADAPGSLVPSGTYRAWLSDGQESPQTRFTKALDPYVLPDGTTIADGFPDLTHGYIKHPINIDPTGMRVGRVLFWTGTNADGTSVSAFVTCDGWTIEDTSGGVAGSTLETDALWSAYRGGLPCSRRARLACFQQ